MSGKKEWPADDPMWWTWQAKDGPARRVRVVARRGKQVTLSDGRTYTLPHCYVPFGPPRIEWHFISDDKDFVLRSIQHTLANMRRQMDEVERDMDVQPVFAVSVDKGEMR